MVSRTILSRLRLPFRHIGLYSILGHSYRFLKIGGMFRRDVRNSASTNIQNSTNTREFLAQTRKNTKRILSRLRLPFRHIGLYSILGHSYRFLKIGGMFRRDVRNPASTNIQNSTNTREFLAQTRKNTKRILSPPRLPFRHTGVFYFTDNTVIIADFSLKIKMQLTTHQISANFLSLFGPRACILRETTSYPKEYSL